MKRRAFLKLLGLGAAVAVTRPATLLPGPASGGPVAPGLYVIGEAGAESLLAYDLLPPARFIYPVLSPFRNRTPRVAR